MKGDVRLAGHRLTIKGVGVFFGRPQKDQWRFVRHGKVRDPQQLGVVVLKAGKIKAFAHGDPEEKHGIPLDHLRNIRKILTKAGRIKRHLVSA
jgi:hypothetical protein